MIRASCVAVHPAAVLVTALVAANLLGLLGVVIAAPFLASVTLLGRYTMRKMLDMEPFPERETELPSPIDSEWIKQVRKLWAATMRRRKQELLESKRGDRNE